MFQSIMLAVYTNYSQINPKQYQNYSCFEEFEPHEQDRRLVSSASSAFVRFIQLGLHICNDGASSGRGRGFRGDVEGMPVSEIE